MTPQELQQALASPATLEELENLLRTQLPDIRLSFYGLIPERLAEQKFDFEDAFGAFSGSGAASELRASQGELPATVGALMRLFLSFFTLAGFYGPIRQAINLLPTGSLQWRALALEAYRNIGSVTRDFVERFDDILENLQRALVAGDEDLEAQCQDCVIDYITCAVFEGERQGIDLRTPLLARIQDANRVRRFSLLTSPRVARLAELTTAEMKTEMYESRRRLVESLHQEACRLVPDLLLVAPPEGDEEESSAPVGQVVARLPAELNTALGQLGAVHRPNPNEVVMGLDANDERNRAYLGTYFPRTVLESATILSELLAIPAVRRAVELRRTVRVLDIGSGTGGAFVGAMLALTSLEQPPRKVLVDSIDGNDNTLSWQTRLVDCWQRTTATNLVVRPRGIDFGTTITEFSGRFGEFSAREQERQSRFDLVLLWKVLSEFYNANPALAIGTVLTALDLIAPLVAPKGLCLIADLTSKYQDREFFPYILNREANEYHAGAQSPLATVCPIPCSLAAGTCRARACYTQRRFQVSHALSRQEESKICYRAFAPRPFAEEIVKSFPKAAAHRVNEARRAVACASGKLREVQGDLPSGFNAFTPALATQSSNGRGRG